MRPAELSDHIVFTEICDMGPATVREVVEGTGLGESTVRRSLKRMEATGRVESDLSSREYGHRSRVYLPGGAP